MRSKRKGLERVMHRLSPRSLSENPTFDAFAISEEGNHPVPTANNILPDPMVNDGITGSSASKLVSNAGRFSSEFAFNMSQASPPANDLSTAASEAGSGSGEVSNQRRLSRGHGRIKSCIQCRQHKVLSRSSSPPK